MASKATTPEVGAKVPDFALPSTAGEFKLSAHRGKHVVLYFYPRDNTPGCTMESVAFRDAKDKFARAGARIFGISRDSMLRHERFSEKYSFSFPLLADEDETVCRLFDVMKEKIMFGKKVRGIQRSTFVIDARGVLRKEWRKVKVPGHVDEVLAFVKTL